MPNYLQYRDRGYMYSPHTKFIPFFRKVDSCVKEIVNDAGFKKHGEELIKVSNQLCTLISINMQIVCVGGSFSYEWKDKLEGDIHDASKLF